MCVPQRLQNMLIRLRETETETSCFAGSLSRCLQLRFRHSICFLLGVTEIPDLHVSTCRTVQVYTHVSGQTTTRVEAGFHTLCFDLEFLDGASALLVRLLGSE